MRATISKRVASSKETNAQGFLNSSQSPIKNEEEKVNNGDLLFEEDVDKYDSFLKKSCVLDSPPNPTIDEKVMIADDLDKRRMTAGFGAPGYPEVYKN